MPQELLTGWIHQAPQCHVSTVEGHPVAAWTPQQDTMVKIREPFSHHRDDGVFLDLLAECAEAGVFHPGSYQGIFRAVYESPRAYKGFNSWLRLGFAGGWEEAFTTGRIPGPLYVYDLNSAYLWAASQWLPDPKSFRIVDTVPEAHGLALVQAVCTADHCPAPWVSGERTVGIVLPGDVERYGLKGVEVWLGVEWDSSAEVVDGIQAAVGKVPMARDILRKTFWGSWAPAKDVQTWFVQRGRIRTRWAPPSKWENLVFAALVVGRVKQRIAEYAGQAVECFVDSVLLRAPIPTGTEFGQWRLVETYRDGLWVYGPRLWKLPDGRYVKCSGRPEAKREHRFPGECPPGQQAGAGARPV